MGDPLVSSDFAKAQNRLTSTKKYIKGELCGVTKKERRLKTLNSKVRQLRII